MRNDEGRPDLQKPTGARPDRWAPWWLYVPVIILANQVKQQLLDGVPVAVNVAVTVAMAAVLVAVITVAWRATHRSTS